MDEYDEKDDQVDQDSGNDLTVEDTPLLDERPITPGISVCLQVVEKV